MQEIVENLKKKYSKYLRISQLALEKAKKNIVKNKNSALALLDMAERYIKDAEFFWEHGKYVEAIAAVAYAHGWIDAASKLRLIKVKDDSLFVLP